MAKTMNIPRFHGLRIYLTATMLYFFLVAPISIILLAKYGPDWVGTGNLSLGVSTEVPASSDQGNDAVSFRIFTRDTLNPVLINDTVSGKKSTTLNSENSRQVNRFNSTINLLIRLILVTFLIGLAFNLPFKIYFSRLRKNRPVNPALQRFVKRFLLKVPLINMGILFVSYGTILIYMASTLLFNYSFDEITRRFFKQYFFISALASLLTLLFVYFWEKHRVHIKYIEHVFTIEELKKRIFKEKAGRIRNRLWIASGTTTLLPLIIVLFYLFLSMSNISDLGMEEITGEQWKILLGKYLAYFSRINLQDFSNFFYVNALDSILMMSGIFTGIFVAIIYILFFVNWTTSGIVQPVSELLRNMDKTGRGEMDQFTIVRTNDEIGVLSEGYNRMTQKLKDYISSISMINEANSRFVPKQFLDHLGKESIVEITLGDQVQSEMTVMFCDIRDFTSLSENMTPRENFNFLNNYLGYMEPVIRKNKGFVDKYIGDSIMAIFSERAEDAINAAIEMRIKLVEFNQVISQFGKPPIKNGMGIHSGNLMLGIVGGEGRMDGTVISDAVNLSSRLEGLNKLYGSSIIISEDTLIRISDPSHYNYRFLDIVKVKGKKEAVYVFEILDGEPEDVRQLKIKTKEMFGRALQQYKSRQFEDALESFFRVFTENPDDLAALVYINRCKKFIRDGVPDEWDGIEKIENK